MDGLVDKIRQGDRRSLARAMSLVAERGDTAEALKDRLRRNTGQVPWWGFTGPPGVGKSTLIDGLLGLLREQGRRVGVVAVDPTSPVSDGALLGDRIRMMRHAVDPDVFIRSLATHHREGGLSDATLHCARLLELARFDPVLIETVGVGQNEADIASVADFCLVMLGPGYGDEIQLIKAGLLQIADIVVVNKCDLPEAQRLLKDVREELGESATMVGDASRKDDAPRVEIVGLAAKSGAGVEHLLGKLLSLDQAARGAERCVHHRHRRLLGEIRRGALSTYERALEHALASAVAQDLIRGLESGELSLEEAIARLEDAARH
ncbi:MAG: methylmalonyl Co-A mutase-associated GTPase MeaB [Planctomycetes bacterium]|nr:methylmalonyl Co-A mutase-associated GTPase MeaB [Planctomycetota bacterium]